MAVKKIPKLVIVNDQMQTDYRYWLIEPMGSHFAIDFKPELTPQQMLNLGVFGGVYLRDCQAEFPSVWFTNTKLATDDRQAGLNYFEVNASQSRSEWFRKGWLHPDDPRGWFQWYCRYFMGRRGPDDTRQIKRWKAMTRHIGQIKANCRPGDQTCRQKQRQALLHWAYDSRLI